MGIVYPHLHSISSQRIILPESSLQGAWKEQRRCLPQPLRQDIFLWGHSTKATEGQPRVCVPKQSRQRRRPEELEDCSHGEQRRAETELQRQREAHLLEAHRRSALERQMQREINLLSSTGTENQRRWEAHLVEQRRSDAERGRRQEIRLREEQMRQQRIQRNQRLWRLPKTYLLKLIIALKNLAILVPKLSFVLLRRIVLVL